MSLITRLNSIKQLIHTAELNCGRKPNSVTLLAVSKNQSIEAVSEAYNYGLHDFGENYYQEALPKINALAHLTIHWHFIGPIQSNKVAGIAKHFDWVHSIDRIKIAELLNDKRKAHQTPLNVCIQINQLAESSKSGVAPEKAGDLALMISKLPHLKLCGLMTIPPPSTNEEQQYQIFLQLNQLMHNLNQQLDLNMDTLSMGMSDDFNQAIRAGSTIIRIGRAIFGERIGAKK